MTDTTSITAADASTAVRHELLAICDTCKTPVEDGQGHVWVSEADVHRYEADQAAFDEQHPPPNNGLRVLGWMTFISRPERARWQVAHSRCAAGPAFGDYSLAVEDCRTWADLTLWSARVFATRRAPNTDWTMLLRSAAAGDGTRITPATPPVLNTSIHA